MLIVNECTRAACRCDGSFIARLFFLSRLAQSLLPTRVSVDLRRDDDGGGGGSDETWTYGQTQLKRVVLYKSWASLLEPGVYINNGLVDFYLRWTQAHSRASNNSDEIFVFTTDFFNMAQKLQPQLLRNPWDPEKMSGLQKLTGPTLSLFWRHKIMVFPVCDDTHYALIVVSFLMPEGPKLLTLDSMPAAGRQLLATAEFAIGNFLTDAYHLRMNAQNDRVMLVLPRVDMKVPLQRRGSNDCGPLMLRSAEILLQHDWGKDASGFTVDKFQRLINDAADQVPNMRQKIRDAFDASRTAAAAAAAARAHHSQ